MLQVCKPVGLMSVQRIPHWCKHVWHIPLRLSLRMRVLFAQTYTSTTTKLLLGDLSLWPNMVQGTGTDFNLLPIIQPLSNTPEAQQEGIEIHSTVWMNSRLWSQGILIQQRSLHSTKRQKVRQKMFLCVSS